MSKDKDRCLGEREKIENEISRSLSVAKMKEAHKHIEDVEKLRKQASIKSICERIRLFSGLISGMMEVLLQTQKEHPNQKFDWIIPDHSDAKKTLDNVVAMYESIHFDFQRTIDVKKEDFDRLFPKMEFGFSTYESIVPNLNCLRMRLLDIATYCLRLL